MSQILCKMTDSGTILRARALKTMWQRLQGLLGSDEHATPVALCNCSSIHTWGMHYAIDVAFVARNGKVIRSVRALRPRRFASVSGAYYVLERPSCTAPWPQEGSWLSVAEVGPSTFGILSLAF